jgi:phage baseplate assembly protein V
MLSIDMKNSKDSKGLPNAQIQLLDGEVQEKVIFTQNYGFYSMPSTGSRALVIFPKGCRNEGILLIADKPGVRPNNMNSDDVLMKHIDGDVLNMTGSELTLSSADAKDVNLIASNADMNITANDLIINARNVKINLSSGGKFSINDTHLTVDA